jgi:hypothetical protein
MGEMPEISGSFRPDAKDRQEMLTESKRRLAESTDVLLGYCGREIADTTELDRFFRCADEVLHAVEYVSLLQGDDAAAAETAVLLMKSFGFTSFITLGAGDSEPWMYGSDEVEQPILGRPLADSEELARLKDLYFQRARRVLATGFGERYAETLLGREKSALLQSKGVDPQKNPLGYASFGEAMLIGADEREYVKPKFMIRPSVGKDLIWYRPPAGDEWNGRSFSFRVDVTRLGDAGIVAEAGFVEDRLPDSGTTDSVDPSRLAQEFSEHIFPDFCRAFEAEGMVLRNTALDYLPIRFDSGEASPEYRRIIRSKQSGYAIVS